MLRVLNMYFILSWQQWALLQLLSAEFVVDRDSGLRLLKATVSPLWPLTDCIPVKNTLGRSAVVFYSCEIIEIFYVVFCVVWAVHKWLKAYYKRKQKLCCAVTEAYFLTVYMVFPDRRHNGLLRSMHSLPITLQNKWCTLGQNFLCALSVTRVRTAFRGRAAPVLVYKERESTFLMPVKRNYYMKFLWFHCHILFLHVVRLNEI